MENISKQSALLETKQSFNSQAEEDFNVRFF